MNVYHAVAVARANLPKLTLAQRVVDKIVRNALVYETETGESLVGCAVKALGLPEPDLYVLKPSRPTSAIRAARILSRATICKGTSSTGGSTTGTPSANVAGNHGNFRAK
jgi:hypothetical protein